MKTHYYLKFATQFFGLTFIILFVVPVNLQAQYRFFKGLGGTSNMFDNGTQSNFIGYCANSTFAQFAPIEANFHIRLVSEVFPGSPLFKADIIPNPIDVRPIGSVSCLFSVSGVNFGLRQIGSNLVNWFDGRMFIGESNSDIVP